MAAKLHQRPPLRAVHLGSLLRPDNLLKTRNAADNGVTTEQEPRAVEDTTIQDIVELQINLGFHPISNGEYRRHNAHIHTFSSLTH